MTTSGAEDVGSSSDGVNSTATTFESSKTSSDSGSASTAEQ